MYYELEPTSSMHPDPEDSNSKSSMREYEYYYCAVRCGPRVDKGTRRETCTIKREKLEKRGARHACFLSLLVTFLVFGRAPSHARCGAPGADKVSMDTRGVLTYFLRRREARVSWMP